MKSVLKKVSLLLTIIVMGIMVGNVKAVEVKSIETFDDLVEVSESGGQAKLDANVTLTNDIRLRADLTLDLNGHTINTDRGWTLIILSKVTLKDSVGTGKVTSGDLGAWESGVDYQMIQVGSNAVDAVGELTVESGTLDGKFDIYTRNGKTIINSGTVKATKYCVLTSADMETVVNGGKFESTTEYQAFETTGGKIVFNDGELKVPNGSGIVAFKDSVVEINGGLIDTKDFALSGNGSASGDNEGTNAKFTITGGTLKASEAPAVYVPQINGVTTISGGKLISGKSAIEIRAGKLTITDGEFESTYIPTVAEANGNGSTTKGAAVAVAQHTTKQPIDVKISGGVFKAFTPFMQSNPQNNEQEDINKVKIEITGGEFYNIPGNSEVEPEYSVYSENFEKFISGGAFSIEPEAKYIAENLVSFPIDDYFYVIENVIFGDDESPVALLSDEALPSDYFLKVDEASKENTTKAEKKIEEKFKDDKEKSDTKLLALYDITMNDSAGVVEMEDGNFLIYVEIDKDLLKYDHYKVLYFDKDGNVKEIIDASLVKEVMGVEIEEDNVLAFETTHLSTYGVIGYNDAKVETEKNPNTLDRSMLYISIGLVSLGLAAITYKKLKKQYNRV